MKTLSVVLSLLLAGLPAAAQGSAAALTRIGAAAAVHGRIQATAPGQVGRVISSGKPLYLNDRVVSDAAGRMQVMLLDQTVFTLGPNADMVLDEFVYDPGTGAGKLTARITKGAFRFVTGLIARRNPESMKVKLAVGTIGIRGTVVVGETGPDGSVVANAGAGAGNNANEPPSALYVENEGVTVNVEQTGQGTTVAPGAPPAPPTDMSGRIGSISGDLESSSGGGNQGGGAGDTQEGQASGGGGGTTPSEGGEGEGGGATGSIADAGDDAGEGTASGGTFAKELQTFDDSSEDMTEDLTQANQDEVLADIQGLQDGVANWEQLLVNVPSGQGFYQTNGAFYQYLKNGIDISLAPDVGTWGYTVSVDFGTHDVSGNFFIDTLNSGTATGNINNQTGSFGFSYEGSTGGTGWAAVTGDGNGVATFQFLNQGGETAAAVLGSSAYVSEVSGLPVNVGFGDIMAAPRGVQPQ